MSDDPFSFGDDEAIDLEEFDAPPRKDFRRIGRGIPYVMMENGKRKRLSRSSKAGDILDDQYNLVDWRLRTAIVGAAQRYGLMAMVTTIDPGTKEGKRELRTIVEECIVAGKGAERSTQGTAMHAMFDHLDRGDDWEPAPQFLDVCNAYLETCIAYGLVVENPDTDIEIHCVNDEFLLAGSADRIYRTTKPLVPPDGVLLPAGQYLIGDTKTGDTLEWSHGTYACQLAAYAGSVRYDVEAETRTPFDPPLNDRWGIIMHARQETGTCELHWVDLAGGREGLALARHVKAWRKRAGLIANATPPVAAAPVERPPEPRQSPGEASTGEGGPDMRSAVRDWLRGRVVIVREHGGAAVKALQLAWPVGVAGLKLDGHTMAELDAIGKALDRVEGDYGVPFGETDPRIKARHPSSGSTWVDKWASPSSEPTPDDQRETQRQAIANHPRRGLLEKWVADAMGGGVDSTIDTYALSNALYEFAKLNAVEWPDDDLTIMLDGSLRALGYANGTADLGRFNPEHAPKLMAAAFAIAAGTITLVYDDDGKPTTSVPIS